MLQLGENKGSKSLPMEAVVRQWGGGQRSTASEFLGWLTQQALSGLWRMVGALGGGGDSRWVLGF